MVATPSTTLRPVIAGTDIVTGYVTRMIFFSKIKLTIPEFNGTYDPNAYLEWELAVDKKFACHTFSAHHQVKAATSEFTHFASIWWREHCNKHPTEIPTTWDALKVLMRHRFVPSYYARDLLNKLQHLK
jgi:hypothetical protein